MVISPLLSLATTGTRGQQKNLSWRRGDLFPCRGGACPPRRPVLRSARRGLGLPPCAPFRGPVGGGASVQPARRALDSLQLLYHNAEASASSPFVTPQP